MPVSFTRSTTLTLALPLAPLVLSAAAFAQPALPRLSTVALTGTPAPGTTGLSLASLADPFVNESGTIVFWAQLGGTGVTPSNDGTIYIRQGGVNTLLGREGTPISLPAGGTSTISGLPTAAIAANGTALFAAGLVDSTTGVNTNLGLVRASPGGGLTLLIRDAANPPAFDLPGLPQAAFDGDSVFSTGFSIRSAYQGLLYTTATPIPNTHNGIPANWAPVAFSPIAMRTDGRAVWATTFGLPTGTAQQRAPQQVGIVTDATGSLSLIAATGGTTPTAPWDVVFTRVSAGPILTDDGSVYFVGSFSGVSPGQAIFSRNGDVTQRVVESGQVVGGVQIGRILEPVRMSPAGDLVFSATLAGAAPGFNTAVFVRPAGGSPVLLLRRGDAAPGLSGGELIDGFGPLVASSRGLIGNVVRLRGPGVTGVNNEVLYLQTRSGEFIPAVRSGDPFTPPGSTTARVIKRALFAGDLSGYSPLTRRGMVVFTLEFSDYSRGIFAADIECPADINEDGGVDSEDVSAFFALWESADSAADFDGSGAVDSADVVEFFRRVDGGC